MKQVQYRRAASSPGFRPIQISGNEIARMREESARVVQGMRDVRDAEIRERERQLADEKQAQQLEAKQIQRNRQIQTAADQNTMDGLQQEARVKQAQYQQDLEDNTKILQGISTLSQSADKAYTQYVEAEEDKTIAQELEDYLNNPNDAILTSLRSELGLDVLDEMEQSKLDEYAAAGGDPLVVAKGRNYSNRVRREILKGKAAYFYQYKYSQLLDEAIRAEEDRLGRTMSSAELAGYMTEVGGIVAERFRTQGGMSLKPGSMRTALEYREKIHMNRLSTARSQEIENELKQSADNATSILTNNPADFEQNIVSSFQMYRRAKGNDYAAAHDWYESLYTMRGPDGKYLFTEEQLASTVLMAGEKPYAQQRPGRHAAGLRARMVDDTNYRKQQINAENVAFKEAEQNALEYIVESGGQKDVVEAAVGKFRDTYGRVPETINKYLENYTVEAQTKAKQIEYLQAIPDGFIRKEHVDSLKALDVKAGNDLEKRRAAQEAKYNSGVFKDQSDAFKTAANGVTSFGSQKPNNASSLFLQQEMRAEYRKRVDQAVAGGMEFNAAANTVAMQLTKEVETGSRDPNSLWYRKPSKAGGAADFPNLTGGNLTALEKARRNYQGIVKSVAENGLEKTLDTAESILTREEIVSIIAGYGKPGFVIPIDVRAVTGMGNGLDPFTVINRQINALGDPNLLPLEPPAIIQNINDTMTEQERTSLFSGITGPLERVRALQQGSSRLTGDVSRFTNSSYMRAGSPIRQAIGSRSEKALIQTIREVEGTADEKGYDKWFGGRTDMKMRDLNLQEVYDEQTRRMNAGETTYNGISSAAVGIGQFMDPLNQAKAMYAARGLEFDPTKIKFDEKLQNDLALDLAFRKRGIDPSKELTKEDFDVLQKEWAGLGTYHGQTNRTTDDSYSIYQRNLLSQ